ncbi:hypothetical protein B0A55_04509 [Friedmanniomyces simplex]|uniref:Uncharacterized protein n=1 Tax=Friedmanniomyces simplex TaxID=329884 RepID=A0A4U0XMW1_9PEZI|nr:hypothetical protein B0A55_04509 [Friedmanniomyces simplex]
MLHTWFSSMIRQKNLDLLEAKVHPLIDDVVQKIVGKAGGSLQRKTWKFSNSTIRLTLLKEQWSALLCYLQVPTGVTEAVAWHTRTAVTMVRRDHIDRSYLAQLPPHRLCKEKFRADGILLPYGNSTEAFNTPNPTLFQTAAWPMMDPADPLDGWDWCEVLKTNSGLATNDLYGKLTVYLKQLFSKFHDSLEAHPCTFSLFNVDAASLPHHLPNGTFARIEVSNIVDGAYLGIAKTLDLLGPLS